MTLDYELVDVFTGTPFAGNPLAVVLGADDLSTAQCQRIAAEFNLSETAFPMRTQAAGADYRLRIFTPATELPFAGHPSVGAAWVMARLGRVAPGRVVQDCGAGLLPLQVAPDGGPVTLTGGTPTWGDPLDPAPLLAAAGLAAVDLADGPPPRRSGAGLEFAYLPVRSDAVARARPVGSVVVVDWNGGAPHVRVFADDVGVPEDPATGSAAVGLGVWAAVSGLVAADGVTAYEVSQGAEMGRLSRLSCVVRCASGRAEEVRVAGDVVPVGRGQITVPPA